MPKRKNIFFRLILIVVICNPLHGITQNIVIQTKNISLVYKIADTKTLVQLYFGKKLSNTSEYSLIAGRKPEAFPAGGSIYALEPAIEVTHADGNPSLQLNYLNHTIQKFNDDVVTTDILLKDPVYPFTLALHFEAYNNEDVIEAWTSIEHAEKLPVILQRYASSGIFLNANKYYLMHFFGDWASEMRMEETLLPEGVYSIQSKLGTRATNFDNPSFMVSSNKPAEENEGDVFAGTLAWSGNFNLQFENIKHGDAQGLQIIPGINAYASAYSLAPNKVFTTPHFIFTYSFSGTGTASRNLHRWALNYGIWNGKEKRQTLLNNWESTYFNFNQDTLVNLFDGAKKLGVDLFLLDDGWFGNKYPRNNDNAGLGDWDVNRKKLPDGIGYLVKQAQTKGIKFGIWVEPEMVNPKSELYEKHPDWIIKLPNRAEDLQRHQLVLDLCNPKVQDYVFGILYKLMTDNPGIAFIKWDCNRYITNAYSPYLGKNQSALYVNYVEGFYKVLERFRKAYPTLEMMLCSGGGGRAEYGALKYFQEFWPSDNTDGLQRIFIQWGYSYFFPSATLCNHVTSGGDESLKFKIDVAMTGKLGFDIPVNRLSEKEITFCHKAVENYNRLQSTISFGSLYRLIAPYNNNSTAQMYVSDDKKKAVLFAYNLYTKNGDSFSKLKPEGLDPLKKYILKEINIDDGNNPSFKDSGKTYSGDFLMKEGFKWYLQGSLKSSVLEITAVE
ncbi:MAG: alpha-galactosidase [Bacteroidota bacterium]|nr:alpha-galactosidase [Bacteroidota bacterium]